MLSLRGTEIKINKYQLVLAYYAMMLVALLIIMRPESTYALPLRLLYFTAIVIPLFYFPKLMPPVITCFWGICTNSFYALLPDNYLFLIALVLALSFIHKRKLNYYSNVPLSCALLLIYTLVISMLYVDVDQNFLKMLFLFILIIPYVQDQDDVFMLALSICVMSFCLAILYLKNFSYYADFAGQTDHEIGAWGNRNVLSGAVACGVPISLAILVGFIKGNKPTALKAFLITGIIACVIVLFSAGSRGSVIATGLSSLLILFSVKGNTRNKLIIIVLLAVFLVFLYNKGVMDYFLQRLTEADSPESAGGRTGIWKIKLREFGLTDIPTIFFGMGRNNCIDIGIYYSTHNDFVTALIAFGIVGFSIFISLFSKPLAIAIKNKQYYIFALWSLILVEGIVLEPFFRGYLPFYLYYLLLLKLVSIQREE